MKNLIVALLLFVLSVQAMGAATGVGVLNASRALAQNDAKAVQAANTQSAAPSASLEANTGLDDLTIFAIAEELSDYLMHDAAALSFPPTPPSAQAGRWSLLSIVLPRQVPPPRS